jgi:peptidoglycan-associated lipoprotein
MNNAMSWVGSVFASTLIVGTSVGCGHASNPAPASSASSGITQTTSAMAPKRAGNLVMSGNLLQQCNIDVNNETTAPKFNFDQAQIVGQDSAVLDQVARCVTTGPLKGRTLTLVGRADPRGEQEYNMALGSSRANSVAKYLGNDGVAASQLVTTSRGKLDATGTDDAGWALDRRVDVDLR